MLQYLYSVVNLELRIRQTLMICNSIRQNGTIRCNIQRGMMGLKLTHDAYDGVTSKSHKVKMFYMICDNSTSRVLITAAKHSTSVEHDTVPVVSFL